jgi:hypothetical protein
MTLSGKHEKEEKRHTRQSAEGSEEALSPPSKGNVSLKQKCSQK